MDVPKFTRAKEAARWIADTINEGNWTRVVLARDREGTSIGVEFAKAVKFCALGWIYKANQGFEPILIERLSNILFKQGHCGIRGLNDNSVIWEFNDNWDHKYPDIKAIFVELANELEAEDQNG